MTTPPQQKPFIERRQGPSLRGRLVAWLSIGAWLSFIVGLVFFHYARPELEYGVFRYGGIDVRSYWLEKPRYWFEVMMGICATVSLASLVINHQMMRRKQDRLPYNIVILLLMCISILMMLFVEI